MDDTSIIRAFALGYYHGRADGIVDCPFKQDEYKAAYRDGFNAGVEDYQNEGRPNHGMATSAT